ncbi:hypothetical protein KA005_47755 [bacterium]|nr:hypothetical protein [bacterium]
MMKKFSGICFILFCFTVFPLLAQTANQDPVSKLIAEGDVFADEWKHEDAAIAYTKALKIDPDNYEANWKAGDQYTEIADRLPEKEKRQKEIYFKMAKEFCEEALKVNPDGWEAHFRLSVAFGRLALFRGGKEKIKLSKMVKAEAEKAIQLNPEADLVYHVLGRWHQNVADLSGTLKFFAKVLYGGVPPASNKDAVKMFKKAIKIDPNHIEHHLELGRTYKLMKKKPLARKYFQNVLKLTPVDEDDNKFIKEAKELLKKVK